MDEVDLQAVDLHDELRQRVQLRFDLPPVMAAAPVAGERLEPSQLHALRLIRERFPIGPPRRVDALAEVVQFLLRDVDAEGANLESGLDDGAHGDLLC